MRRTSFTCAKCQKKINKNKDEGQYVYSTRRGRDYFSKYCTHCYKTVRRRKGNEDVWVEN